ncbi:F-box/kelch-repeat protein At2g44130-like [Durio zibethinus]|uniref:F-box/kelch-repeat protein At2g44130-like n=1 Tax=Durio zibethinus TaxID=66656 RepID=A0A6P6APP8_DURZI|nr:F-box/kelch-repeat protein At2g44130-like [Durio zibethinus]
MPFQDWKVEIENKKKKHKMLSFELLSELIPGLPEEIGFECLARFHYSTHSIAARVCRRWQDLLQSREFYHLRKQTGYTQKAACLVQLLNSDSDPDGSKSVGPPRYGITVFDPVSRTWDRIEPVPKYPDGLPLFCQITSSEGKIVVMGGWDPTSYDPVRDVFIYDFTSQKWRQGKQMPETRSFFATGELDGRIIVAGGHDENKNALSTAWEYDVNRDEWTELTRMSQERDECQGMVIGSEFWAVSGYRTDIQGGFEGSAEFLDLGTGQWSRVEEAWEPSQCPRSCVGVEKEKTLFCWADCDSAIRVGACAVPLGEWTFVSGSAYQGGPQGFFLVDEQSGKFNSIAVPVEFSGFVQSGCCVDI